MECEMQLALSLNAKYSIKLQPNYYDKRIIHFECYIDMYDCISIKCILFQEFWHANSLNHENNNIDFPIKCKCKTWNSDEQLTVVIIGIDRSRCSLTDSAKNLLERTKRWKL